MDLINPITISGKIEPGQFYDQFVRRLSEVMEGTAKGDQVTVFINSSGGDTHTSLAIYELLRSLPRKVVGIVAGRAESGASLILQACEKRWVTKNSTLALHRSTICINGSVDDAQKAVDNFRRLDKMFLEVYRERSSSDIEIGQGDQHYTAEEAVAAGLADAVL